MPTLALLPSTTKSLELAGGRTAKLFGSEKAIAKELAILGLKLESIKSGKRLSVPCLVLTKVNGKYLNVDRVFPPATKYVTISKSLPLRKLYADNWSPKCT